MTVSSININKPIVLVGMMGSGKSTVGRRLSRKLRMQFYDSDKVIESREAALSPEVASIANIVYYKGDAYLKQKEEEVIKEILGYGPIILSTGGNSFLNPQLRELILSNSIVIWLQADFDTLYERISRRNTRPEFNVENKHTVLESMMEERSELYKCAHIHVQSNNEDISNVVNSIISRLAEYVKKDS